MSKSIEREKKIKILQENLSSLRKIAGWTAEELGDRIGVTKQTISNLENGKTPMNFTQYIAIRAIFDCEIQENKENDVLAKAVNILLEQSEDLDGEIYKKIKDGISTVAATAAGGVSGAALMGVFSAVVVPITSAAGLALLGPIGAGAAVGIAASLGWLKDILKGKEKLETNDK